MFFEADLNSAHRLDLPPNTYIKVSMFNIRTTLPRYYVFLKPRDFLCLLPLYMANFFLSIYKENIVLMTSPFRKTYKTENKKTVQDYLDRETGWRNVENVLYTSPPRPWWPIRRAANKPDSRDKTARMSSALSIIPWFMGRRRIWPNMRDPITDYLASLQMRYLPENVPLKLKLNWILHTKDHLVDLMASRLPRGMAQNPGQSPRRLL